MNTDTQEKKTLGQINYDTIRQSPGSFGWEWKDVSAQGQAAYESGAVAVKAAVLAEQAGGELSEEEIELAAMRVYESMRVAVSNKENGPTPTWYLGGNSDMQFEARRTARNILSSRPSTPLVYHNTKERPPTEKDGEYIHAWDGYRWVSMPFYTATRNPVEYSLWMPMPPAPVPVQTEEDLQFEQALIDAGFGSSTYNVSGKEDLRRLFKAGMAYTKGKQEE